MLGSLAQIVLTLGATWVIWKTYQRIFVKGVLDNLPGPPSTSLLYGNLKQLYDQNGWDFHRELGEKYGSAVQLHGAFGQKMLYVFDPKAMHAIVKEHYIYDEARWFLSLNHVTFGPGLLSTTGEQHRRQRKMLNPAINTNYLRDMTPIFYEVTHKLRAAIANRLKDGPAEVDMITWTGRTALELLGQAGLGHSLDPLTEEGSDLLGSALKSYIPALFALSQYLNVLPYVEAGIPAPLRRTAAKYLPHAKFQRLRELVNIMHDRSSEIYQEKKSAFERGDEAMGQQLREGDLMSRLLRANMSAGVEDRLSEDELIAQISSLTLVGMNTTSNALSVILYRLAKHPEVQEKLRQELLEVQNGNDNIGYDDLAALPYLDAICRETLRLHAPAPLRFRETREDVVLPLSEPVRGRDGRMISEIPLPKDSVVVIGVLSSNNSKALWGENAYEWKPERWLSPLPHAVTEAKIPGVYSNLMTFWGGGRACLGFRFSQLEIKVVLSILITNFTFELAEKPIHWNLAGIGIVFPTSGTGTIPSLPLKVSLLESA